MPYVYSDLHTAPAAWHIKWKVFAMPAAVQKPILIKPRIYLVARIQDLSWTGTPSPSNISPLSLLTWFTGLLLWFMQHHHHINKLFHTWDTSPQIVCADAWLHFQNWTIQVKLIFQAFYLFNKRSQFPASVVHIKPYNSSGRIISSTLLPRAWLFCNIP